MDDYKAIESGKDYLSHHGVKGMKWGIRHDPEPSGRTRASKDLGKAVRSTVRKVAKGLKRASRTSIRTAKRIHNRNLQRKIEKIIASGNSTKVNKVFSKMNDAQAARAVNRVNQREAILRAKAEDGRRSLKNINMQRKIDAINLRRQYNKAKHPNLYTVKDNTVNNGSKIVSTKLATAMSEAIINKAKKIAEHPDKVVKEAEKAAKIVSEAENEDILEPKKVADYITRLQHSDFMDIGEDFIAHHGVKGMKWGIRHDEERISSLKLKKAKNQLRLDKAKGKKAKFNTKHRALTAGKAEIRLAKGKNPGLLGRLALTKSKKLDYKIAKLERKDAKLDKKISNIKNKKDLQNRVMNGYSGIAKALKAPISKMANKKAGKYIGKSEAYDEIIAELQWSKNPADIKFVNENKKIRDKLIKKANKYYRLADKKSYDAGVKRANAYFKKHPKAQFYYDK